MNDEWARCLPFLKPALDREGRWTPDQARGFVERGEALFWPGKQSAMLTERIRDVRLWAAGGSLTELLDMEQAVSAWAKADGAEVLSIDGRKGWARVLAPRGYRPVTVLVKEL